MQILHPQTTEPLTPRTSSRPSLADCSSPPIRAVTSHYFNKIYAEIMREFWIMVVLETKHLFNNWMKTKNSFVKEVLTFVALLLSSDQGTSNYQTGNLLWNTRRRSGLGKKGDWLIFFLKEARAELGPVWAFIHLTYHLGEGEVGGGRVSWSNTKQKGSRWEKIT